MNHLSFRYQDDMPLVIDDLSLSIKAGEYVGIVGTSGCGKSTLLRLLLGLRNPSVAIYTTTTTTWRRLTRNSSANG